MTPPIYTTPRRAGARSRTLNRAAEAAVQLRSSNDSAPAVPQGAGHAFEKREDQEIVLAFDARPDHQDHQPARVLGRAHEPVRRNAKRVELCRSPIP